MEREKFPPRLLKLCAVAAVTTVVYILANIPAVAEAVFARGVTRWAGWLLSRITNFISVSFYEWIAVLLVLGALALIVLLVVWLCKKNFARVRGALYRLLLAGLCVLLAFGVLYAPLYDRNSVYSALGLEEREVSEEDVFAAAEYYIAQLNGLSAAFSRDGEGNILPPHGFEETADLLNAEYDKLSGGYFAGYEVRPKQVVLSVPMTYLGITGIYFPFTAEANVNVNIPAYELPATMAHEMAHAKGVSQEGEANLTAYVLCLRSENEYLQYSGLMNAAAVLVNALPEERSSALREKFAPEVLQEYANASAHYAKYDSFLDDLSSFFNDLFLKSNGVESGTRSYSQTTRGLVALYYELSA